jgi:carbon-monoxide dehydrogenase medium subunit
VHRERRRERQRLGARRARRVAATPILVEPASADDDAVRDAVRGAGIDPPSDVHASSEYRTHLAEVLAVRAAREAKGKA